VAGTALFVYGTLMDERLLATLTGRRFARRPARLEGFARLVPAGGYAYVVPRAGAHVDGLLLEDVDPVSLCRLDAYEEAGRLYQRRPAEVIVDGERRRCEVYVGLPAVMRPRAHAPAGRRGPTSGA
jgi:gamma-glutamylcyclotransferase (GGCT)/AIG2-like uncharacterized protein YtfP